MEFVIFSDLHVDEHPIFSSEDGHNLSLDIIKSVLGQIRKYVVDNNIRLVFHAGDLFEVRNKIPVRFISLVQEELYKFKQVDLVLLRGTPFHEGEGDSYSGTLFRRMYNVTVFDNPDIYYTEDGALSFYMLPWNSKENLASQLNKWSKEKSRNNRGVKILVGHYALSGAKTLAYEAPLEQSLSKVDLRFFDWAFMGHYHRHQEVWRNSFQVGSPYRIDFSERNDDKGFIHWKDGKVKVVSLAGPGMVQLNVNLSLGKSAIIPNLVGSFVKVVIEGTESQIKKYDQVGVKKELLDRGALGVRFEFNRVEDNKEVRQVRIKKESDTMEMLDRYIDFLSESGQISPLDVGRVRKIGKLAMEGRGVNGNG